MKKFQQLVMAFLVGVVSFGFTACSDDNSEPQDFQLPEVGQATVSVNSSRRWRRFTSTRLFTQHTRHSLQTHAHSTPQQLLSTALLRQAQ